MGVNEHFLQKKEHLNKGEDSPPGGEGRFWQRTGQEGKGPASCVVSPGQVKLQV